MTRRAFLLAGLALGFFIATGAWAASETCKADPQPAQCSKEIAVTTANSTVTFGFSTTEVCVTNKSVSTTIYVEFTDDDAVGDPDESHPIEAEDTYCLGSAAGMEEVNIITSSGTATAQVLALKVF